MNRKRTPPWPSIYRHRGTFPRLVRRLHDDLISKLGIARRLAPPMPELDVPILARHWTAWVPPGYESPEEDLAWQPRRRTALSWNQRLFGPLGQAANAAPFDPLTVRGLGRTEPATIPNIARQLAKPSSCSKCSAALVHRRQQRAQGRFSVELGPNSSPKESIGKLGLRVLVDRRALARIGLSPGTPVPNRLAGDAAQCGIELLQRADLALLIQRDNALLTSAKVAALWQAQLQPLGCRVLWRVLPGPLTERLREAGTDRANASLVSPRVWQAGPAEGKSPWLTSLGAEHNPSDTRGWNAYSMDVSAAFHHSTAPARLTVVHRATLESLRWIAMLAAIAAGWWKAGDRPVALALAAGISAMCALLLSTIAAVIASGTLLGFLLCLGFRLLRGRPEEHHSQTDSVKTRSALAAASTQALRTTLFVLATLLPYGSVLGDEPTPTRAPYRVFVPTDKEKKPSGAKVYVPEGLYNELNELAAGPTRTSRGWILEEATYRGELSWQATPKRLMPGELRASYRLRVFGPGAKQVRIALHREGHYPAG